MKCYKNDTLLGTITFVLKVTDIHTLFDQIEKKTAKDLNIGS
jgi:hypothetical protein